ncbi:MAG: MarR family transcriptional regulator [Staphylococcus equorum]|uniref:transcriptional regulator, SarA/Rot family n=1 Tax=Staphylococcus TaxID=1279 RepID=UPI000852BDF9|nr:transcriptional regulator [Staphylococcus equorum]MDG0821928.1 MarR family transcriptional regulator [Staphylococcus equorum]MDG0838429.1 MarR family transcriptional regulator [Staphylococcus equorum]MDK9871774.1 MarR family transcriptional regulator [Staphylococcus equorum]MDK9877115.1 MarR family transcriptional regulator [Staphylococcus equorum]MDN5829938.1 MarR family transcriptional regulator [Staphylococcus equorum]
MNMITYEEKRSLIKKVIKQNLNLTFNEIVILDKLLYINKESIEAVELKRLLYSQNTPISIQINNLIELGLLKKSRDAYDERCIHLHNIDLSKIKSILEQYHTIVTSILNPSTQQ